MGDPAPRAVVLLSGGLDSATTLAIADAEGFSTFALTIRYGQRHEQEVAAAEKVARISGVREHRIAAIDMGFVGGSALTDSSIELPTGRTAREIGDGIPVTYVPARNTIFLSLALAWAEVLEAGHLFIGVNALDYSGYPDCRPEFLEAFERLAGVATREGVTGNPVKLHAPLIEMTKAQIICRAVELGVDLSLTVSCYQPDIEGRGCGVCDACRLRARGFSEAGMLDPAS
jgi:7-cyano-7-deazaguanine synthase